MNNSSGRFFFPWAATRLRAASRRWARGNAHDDLGLRRQVSAFPARWNCPRSRWVRTRLSQPLCSQSGVLAPQSTTQGQRTLHSGRRWQVKRDTALALPAQSRIARDGRKPMEGTRRFWTAETGLRFSCTVELSAIPVSSDAPFPATVTQSGVMPPQSTRTTHTRSWTAGKSQTRSRLVPRAAA